MRNHEKSVNANREAKSLPAPIQHPPLDVLGCVPVTKWLLTVWTSLAIYGWDPQLDQWHIHVLCTNHPKSDFWLQSPINPSRICSQKDSRAAWPASTWTLLVSTWSIWSLFAGKPQGKRHSPLFERTEHCINRSLHATNTIIYYINHIAYLVSYIHYIQLYQLYIREKERYCTYVHKIYHVGANTRVSSRLLVSLLPYLLL